MNNQVLKLFYAVLMLLFGIILESFEISWGNLYWISPAWIVVFLIFWVGDNRGPVGISIAWCFGILIDVWSGSALGQNALLFILISFFIKFAYNDFRELGILNQALIVMMIVFIYKILNATLSFGPGILLDISSILYLGTAASSAVLWVLISVVVAIGRQQTR